MLLEFIGRRIQARLQARKIADYGRRVSFGDLVTDRWENARQMGFGDGTSMHDNVLVIGDRKHVKIGKDVWIGPGVILDGSGFLEIGNKCSISAGVQIYTHDTVKWANSLGTIGAEHAPTRIGSGVYIGPNTVIEKGVTIGDGACIGAMSFVNRDIPAGAKAWGCPARMIQIVHQRDNAPMRCPIGYDAL